jgi:hypothetical protein
MLWHFVGTKLYNKTHDIMLVQRQLRHKNLEREHNDICQTYQADRKNCRAFQRLSQSNKIIVSEGKHMQKIGVKTKDKMTCP